MKKIVIVNCFDTYEERVDLLHEYFKKISDDITIIQSDFRHFKKIYRTETKPGFIFIKSKPYLKNLSAARLRSHYFFAKHAFKIVEKINPDILYVMIPPNSLAMFAARYKMKNKNVKLIFDLIDLWPETMPLGKIKKIPPFTFWRLLRDKNLKFADFIITECNLYRDVLKKVLSGIRTKTLYLAKKDIPVNSNPILTNDGIHLCYLGSINNIIDIPKITSILRGINRLKPVTLHIIGDGESKETLITEVEETGTSVQYHGKIFDSQEKQNIFDKCQFGLNIMKESVCVGLTMKSIDYLQHGLPILNNIKADTAEIIDKYFVGVNITNGDNRKIYNIITNNDIEDNLEMRRNSKKVFNSMFSLEKFYKEMDSIINELNLENN